MEPVKKVLAIFYSQSGQLAEIVQAFSQPIHAMGAEVEIVRVKPKKDFDFPWTSESFFDAMPESVLEIPVEMEEIGLKEPSYDLVVLAYQPWYLSPSIPTTSLLAHPHLQEVLKNTPVITLIGARNMWLNAQEKMKKKLAALGTKLVGNVVLVDRHQNHVSAVTILHWMLTGKKDQYLGFFPKPGISEKDIANTRSFGKIVAQHLKKGSWEHMQEQLVREGAVEVKSDLMFIEHRGARLFMIWANLVRRKKNRSTWLVVYKYYLLLALFIVAPLVLLVNNVLFRPFFLKQIARKKHYYSGLN